MEGLQVKLSDVQTKQKEIYQNSIKISHQIEANILIVFVTGKRSLDDSLYYWKKIIQFCQENEIENIQLTLALRGKFEPFEAIKNYQLVIDIVKSHDFNIAIMDLNGLSKKDTKVACNMASSQGMSCTYFDNEIRARAWLNEKSMATA